MVLWLKIVSLNLFLVLELLFITSYKEQGSTYRSLIISRTKSNETLRCFLGCQWRVCNFDFHGLFLDLFVLCKFTNYFKNMDNTNLLFS